MFALDFTVLPDRTELPKKYLQMLWFCVDTHKVLHAELFGTLACSSPVCNFGRRTVIPVQFSTDISNLF
jgi:hypothetical protein